jgi:hypothetical protein
MSDSPQPAGPGPADALVAGQSVGAGRYTLVRPLGRGGMGVVWLAQDERLHEPAALKFLSADFHADPSALDSLRSETQRSRRLTHPHIIRIHDLFEPPGEAPFIAMEYVEGQTLSQLKAGRPQRVFEWEFLRPLVRQLCAALDYAHAERIIHRDLKPANLMLDAKGRLKLADFGIAVAVADSVSRVTGARSISGTPAYMSPQQLDGEPASVSDDLYALGATLYELVTSKPPFHSGDIAHQTRTQDPAPVEHRLAELGIGTPVPSEVSDLVLACLAKDPKSRPASAAEAARRLGMALAPDSAEAARPSADARHAEDSRQATRRSRTAFWLAVVLLAAMGVTAWMVTDDVPSAPTGGAEAGKSLGDGWLLLYEKPLRKWTEEPDRWKVAPDGTIIGVGNKVGMLRTGESFTNFIFFAEAKLAPGANGSVFLRARKQKKGPPRTYIVMLGNTHKGYRKTGSIIDRTELTESPVKDDEWFRLQTTAIGRRIVVSINDRIVVDLVDENPISLSGGIVLWHPGGSVVMFRRPQVKELPVEEAGALAEARKFVSGLR